MTFRTLSVKTNNLLRCVPVFLDTPSNPANCSYQSVVLIDADCVTELLASDGFARPKSTLVLKRHEARNSLCLLHYVFVSIHYIF